MIAETTKLRQEIEKLKTLLIPFADEYHRRVHDGNMSIDRRPCFNLHDLRRVHEAIYPEGKTR